MVRKISSATAAFATEREQRDYDRIERTIFYVGDTQPRATSTDSSARGGRKPRIAIGSPRYDRPMWSLLYLVVRALVRLLAEGAVKSPSPGDNRGGFLRSMREGTVMARSVQDVLSARRGSLGRPGSCLRLALCLATVLATGCGSAAPVPSSTGSIQTAAPNGTASQQAAASAAPSSNGFTSQLYGYQLVVPPGWQGRPAESRWTSGVLGGRCPSDWDCFSGDPDGATLAAAATTVPADLTLSQWWVRIRMSTPETCTDSGPTTDTMLGGGPAQAWTSTCQSEGLDVIKVVALHGARGYIVLFASPTTTGLETDHATLNSILGTFRFAGS
jgi:hypothetical protein